MKNMGIKVVMLTGDNERTAKAIGEQAGVDEVIAGVLPDGKEDVIKKLKEEGKVAMVGDGLMMRRLLRGRMSESPSEQERISLLMRRILCL